jgi:hypothetical protein
MSQSPNRAPGSSGKSRRKQIAFDLKTARRMLPLVRGIVTDIQGRHQTIDRLTPLQDSLDRHRRDLVWAERQHRYRLHDELNSAATGMHDAINELDRLGVALIDPESGLVDFPTTVHNRPAFYSWKPGEETVVFWHFQDDPARRPIPPEWVAGEIKLVNYR